MSSKQEWERRRAARKWIGALPREDFDHLLLLTREEFDRGRREAMREGAAILSRMINEADRNQRPGGGTIVPQEARAFVAKAKGENQ